MCYVQFYRLLKFCFIDEEIKLEFCIHVSIALVLHYLYAVL